MSRTFLFAGASSAIARETARLLKAGGHRVIGISTKAADPIYDASFLVDAYDFGAFPAVDEAIDGLAYFPGTINLKPFARLAAAEFIKDFQVNTLGAAAFVQAYLDPVKKSSQGSVVLMSSVAASMGLPFHTSIAMAKGGVEGLAKALAAELAPLVRVNCVAPSLVNTPLGDRFTNTPEKMEQMKKRNPLHKVGEPAEVANAVAFLLSGESAWVSGQVFAVDGGMGTIKNG